MARAILIMSLLLLAGCSVSFVREPGFTGLHMRLGVDTHLGRLAVSHSPTTRSIELQDLQSIPREDIARAVADGVAAGLARSLTRP